MPGFRKDLESIADYITNKLGAPKAALDLIDATEQACLGVKEFPFSHRVFKPPKPLKTEFRVLSVKNYLVFYTVDNDVIEFHRMIYKKRDLSKFDFQTNDF
jgi:plasmid stabilization system protein ParE